MILGVSASRIKPVADTDGAEVGHVHGLSVFPQCRTVWPLDEPIALVTTDNEAAIAYFEHAGDRSFPARLDGT